MTSRDESPVDAARYVQARAAMWREVTDGLVVLGPSAERPTHVTGSAVRGWWHFARPRSFGEVVDRLAETHGAEHDVVRHDLAEVVAALVRDGALARLEDE